MKRRRVGLWQPETPVVSFAAPSPDRDVDRHIPGRARLLGKELIEGGGVVDERPERGDLAFLVEVADLSAELRERAPVATVVVVHEGDGVSVVCEDVMNLDVERLKAGDHPAEERQDLLLAPVGASVRAASGHVPHDVVGEGIRCPVGISAARSRRHSSLRDSGKE